LVYFERYHSPSTAIAREKQLKGWIRAKKIALIERETPFGKTLLRVGDSRSFDSRPNPGHSLRMTPEKHNEPWSSRADLPHLSWCGHPEASGPANALPNPGAPF